MTDPIINQVVAALVKKFPTADQEQARLDCHQAIGRCPSQDDLLRHCRNRHLARRYQEVTAADPKRALRRLAAKNRLLPEEVR